MKRILVADDSVTIQKVIALTFADEPFEVQSVGTGAEALELVKSWKPDIVLADVIMPQMNGYEVCRAVKQLAETSSVPVLLLAGTFEAFDEEEAKSAGANDFITKPFESGELIAKVKTLIVDAPPASPSAIPTADSVAAATDPGTIAEPVPEPVPEPVQQAVTEAPAPPKVVEASEPDIWDILSETGDDEQGMGIGAPAPGFGPIEDTGVVDVGSFDVGIGRPESPPPAFQPPAAASPETFQIPEAVESEPVPHVEPQPSVPPVPVQVPEIFERSRVENREKDFFGFETGGVEEVSVADFPEDAVEEVTFEMEPPQAASKVDPQEVSFVVPEPVGDHAAITGETTSPDSLAVEQPPSSSPEPAPVPPAPSPASGGIEGSHADGVIERSSANGVMEAPPEVFEFTPDPIPVPELVPPVNITAQPEPEPPFELGVDLTPELPEEFFTEPIAEPVVESPVEAIPEPVMDVPGVPGPEPSISEPMVVAPSQAGGAVPNDAAIRKIVEDKVEKIVWEVVPEMAEVLIREVIQKIKDGS